MDLVQEPVRRLGHMSTRICSTCRKYLHSEDYHPREWKKREKRTCTECRKKEQSIAAAPGIPSFSPEGQYGALSTHTPTPFDQHGAGGASSNDAQCTATPVAASVAHAATPSSPAVIHTFALEFVSTSVNIFSCPAEVVLFSHGFKLWSGCRAEVIQLLKLLLRRPRCSERLFFATWQDLWLSPIRHLRSEVAKRLLRTPFVHLHQGAFQRLLIRCPTPLVVVRREPARRLCPPSW
jgi:hypothetical protein